MTHDSLKPMPGTTGTALITGGTSGIGYAFAHGLAKRGLNLILVARDQERLVETANEIRTTHNVEVSVVSADLATEAGIATVKDLLEAQPIHVFVNNAGRGLHANYVTDELENHLSAVDLMLKAPMILGTVAATQMRERNQGIIINVGSVAGLIPMNNYSAIKSWMNTFSEALVLELAETNIRVMTLLPGWVRTEFHERANVKTSKIPNFLWLSADRLVNDCLRAIERGKTRSVPSKRFKILAFVAVHAPRSAVMWGTNLIRKGRA